MQVSCKEFQGPTRFHFWGIMEASSGCFLSDLYSPDGSSRLGALMEVKHPLINIVDPIDGRMGEVATSTFAVTAIGIHTMNMAFEDEENEPAMHVCRCKQCLQQPTQGGCIRNIHNLCSALAIIATN